MVANPINVLIQNKSLDTKRRAHRLTFTEENSERSTAIYFKISFPHQGWAILGVDALLPGSLWGTVSVILFSSMWHSSLLSIRNESQSRFTMNSISTTTTKKIFFFFWCFGVITVKFYVVCMKQLSVFAFQLTDKAPWNFTVTHERHWRENLVWKASFTRLLGDSWDYLVFQHNSNREIFVMFNWQFSVIIMY